MMLAACYCREGLPQHRSCHKAPWRKKRQPAFLSSQSKSERRAMLASIAQETLSGELPPDDGASRFMLAANRTRSPSSHPASLKVHVMCRCNVPWYAAPQSCCPNALPNTPRLIVTCATLQVACQHAPPLRTLCRQCLEVGELCV